MVLIDALTFYTLCGNNLLDLSTCAFRSTIRLFIPHGKVIDVDIIRDHKTGVSQGRAFVTFEGITGANQAR